MISKATDRAEVIGDRADVRRWVKRLQAVAESMPPGVRVFVASGTPTVMALDEDGQPFKHQGSDGGNDQDAIVATIYGGQWEGGDW